MEIGLSPSVKKELSQEELSLNALSPDFFNRDTIEIAKQLLGHYLIWQPTLITASTTHRHKAIPIAFKIVETEAYTQDDPACHAYQKNKGRAANLYTHPGTAYVYLTYGMYHCLNIVTEPLGIAGAVLIRALEPPEEYCDSKLTHGPGRLCKALGIDLTLNGINLCDSSSSIYISENPDLARVPLRNIITTTRIGITKAVDYPWRFYLPESKWVSKRDKKAELSSK